jgi:hypothetical protein
MEYYWEIILRDGTTYEIKPQVVDLVRKRMAEKMPINLRSATIIPSDIVKFRQTDKPANQPPLLEEAAQAFREPIYTETIVDYGGEPYKYTGVQARWVKKRVTQAQWQNYHSKTMDKRLDDEDGMVVIAYVLPVHSIDLNEVQYCTEDEVAKLSRS